MKYLARVVSHRNASSSDDRNRSRERVSRPRRHNFLDDACVAREMSHL